jgi:hypothetical protein
MTNQVDERREDWDSYRKLVISKLEDFDGAFKRLEDYISSEFRNMRKEAVSPAEALRSEINALKVEIAVLKTKATLFGLGAGVIASAAVQFFVSTIGGSP